MVLTERCSFGIVSLSLDYFSALPAAKEKHFVNTKQDTEEIRGIMYAKDKV